VAITVMSLIFGGATSCGSASTILPAFQRYLPSGTARPPDRAPRLVGQPDHVNAKVGDMHESNSEIQPTQPGLPVADFTVETSMLEGLTTALGIEAAKPLTDLLVGRDIGGVTILRLIAEGGMGRVYEGRQHVPNRTVAVKVLRPGFVSVQASKRFEMELEILGRLRHRSIAQIFSAGICDVLGCSVPFFVMELIPGALPITRYAKANMLGIDARLELFQKVCEAVAHGHELGVVHRDLKPSNILVEATGIPKIIDFGIARTVGDTSKTMTAITELGQLIGTLQYMSPEQIEADPATIDRRTDVYALGIVLYELLTGSRPYELSSHRIVEAARIIRRHKFVSPLKLNTELSPDIVRVIKTCLEKAPRRRYADAGELASAVASCLATREHIRHSAAHQSHDRHSRWRTASRRNVLAALGTAGTVAG
jgi:serine/threonine protein kinase